ncbi:MAG: hypothetical protein QM769_03285 [Pseudoxanthomonas sp.]
MIAELSRLDGAAAGERLGKKEHHDPLAAQLAELHGLAVLRRRRKVRRPISYFKHAGLLLNLNRLRG